MNKILQSMRRMVLRRVRYRLLRSGFSGGANRYGCNGYSQKNAMCRLGAGQVTTPTPQTADWIGKLVRVCMMFTLFLFTHASNSSDAQVQFPSNPAQKVHSFACGPHLLTYEVYTASGQRGKGGPLCQDEAVAPQESRCSDTI